VDVLCLQELKLTDDKFPLDVLRGVGYEHCAVFGQKTYNGVAVMSRAAVRDIVKNIAGFEDEHSRCCRSPSTRPQGRCASSTATSSTARRPAPTSSTTRWRGCAACATACARKSRAIPTWCWWATSTSRRRTATPSTRGPARDHPPHHGGTRPLPQAAGAGLVDSFRLFEQPEKSFSWWDYRMLGYQKNRGLRIDHILVSEALKPRVAGCSIDRAPRSGSSRATMPP
jgi:exodeoxyribonuclease-3